MPPLRPFLFALLVLAAPMAVAQEAEDAPLLPQPRPEGLGETPAETETEEAEGTSEPGPAPETQTDEIDRVY